MLQVRRGNLRVIPDNKHVFAVAPGSGFGIVITTGFYMQAIGHDEFIVMNGIAGNRAGCYARVDQQIKSSLALAAPVCGDVVFMVNDNSYFYASAICVDQCPDNSG